MLPKTARGHSATSTDVRYTARFRGHSGHQPSELSARPPALAVSLPVALLGGFEFFALPLFKLALALLGLGDLPPVDVPAAASGADRRSAFGGNPEAFAYSEPYRFWTFIGLFRPCRAHRATASDAEPWMRLLMNSGDAMIPVASGRHQDNNDT